MEEKKTKKGRKNKNTEKSLCCLPCFNEEQLSQTMQLPQTTQLPQEPFFMQS